MPACRTGLGARPAGWLAAASTVPMGLRPVEGSPCWHALLGARFPLLLQTGYLSMDQARSLVPLHATDSSVSGAACLRLVALCCPARHALPCLCRRVRLPGSQGAPAAQALAHSKPLPLLRLRTRRCTPLRWWACGCAARPRCCIRWWRLPRSSFTTAACCWTVWYSRTAASCCCSAQKVRGGSCSSRKHGVAIGACVGWRRLACAHEPARPMVGCAC